MYRPNSDSHLNNAPPTQLLKIFLSHVTSSPDFFLYFIFIHVTTLFPFLQPIYLLGYSSQLRLNRRIFILSSLSHVTCNPDQKRKIFKSLTKEKVRYSALQKWKKKLKSRTNRSGQYKLSWLNLAWNFSGRSLVFSVRLGYCPLVIQ